MERGNQPAYEKNLTRYFTLILAVILCNGMASGYLVGTSKIYSQNSKEIFISLLRLLEKGSTQSSLYVDLRREASQTGSSMPLG